jgi:hypothetical protein
MASPLVIILALFSLAAAAQGRISDPPKLGIGFTAVSNNFEASMYVFGGCNNSYEFDTLWRYSLDSNEWALLDEHVNPDDGSKNTKRWLQPKLSSYEQVSMGLMSKERGVRDLAKKALRDHKSNANSTNKKQHHQHQDQRYFDNQHPLGRDGHTALPLPTDSTDEVFMIFGGWHGLDMGKSVFIESHMQSILPPLHVYIHSFSFALLHHQPLID